jgi:hypothetical protein
MDQKIDNYITLKCGKLLKVERGFRTIEKSILKASEIEPMILFYERLTGALNNRASQLKDPIDVKGLPVTCVKKPTMISSRLIPSITDSQVKGKTGLLSRKTSLAAIPAQSLKTIQLQTKDIKTNNPGGIKSALKTQPLKVHHNTQQLPNPKTIDNTKKLYKPSKIVTSQKIEIKKRNEISQIIERSQSLNKSSKKNDKALSKDNALNESINESGYISGKETKNDKSQNLGALNDLNGLNQIDECILEPQTEPKVLIIPKTTFFKSVNDLETIKEEEVLQIAKTEANEDSTLGLFDCKYEEIAQNFNSEINIEVDYESYNDNKTLDDHDKMFLFEFLEISKDQQADVFELQTDITEQDSLGLALKQILGFMVAGQTFTSNQRFLSIHARNRLFVLQNQLDAIELQKSSYVKVI